MIQHGRHRGGKHSVGKSWGSLKKKLRKRKENTDALGQEEGGGTKITRKRKKKKKEQNKN